MTDWSYPTLSSTYAAFLSFLKARDDDAAVMFSPDFTTLANTPTGTVRWNPTNGCFEIKSAGGSFGPLISKYMIDVDKLDGQDGSYYLSWSNITGVPSTFTPSAHTHDDRYFTETESDGRFASKLVVSGSTIKLQTPGSTDLSTITVPYATAAGNATTVAGFSVGQNLLTTSSVTFGALTVGGGAVVQGNNLNIGQTGDATVAINFWDNTGATYKSIRWNSTISEWQVEDSTETYRRLFHEGHLPEWTEVANKPTTFAPSAHGHAFSALNKAVLYGLPTASMISYLGSAGEIVYNTSTKRVVVHDGVTTGGIDLQPYDATLASLATLGTAAGKMAYTTGVDTWAETAVTTAGRNMLAAASTGEQRALLELGQFDTNCRSITDWNDVTESGLYYCEGTSTGHAPTTGLAYSGFCIVISVNTASQTVSAYGSSTEADTVTYRREKKSGVWGAWYRLRTSETEIKALMPPFSAGAVGSYGFLKYTGTTDIDTGDVVSGSSLIFSNAGGSTGTTTVSGTWKCMGNTVNTDDTTRSSLFLRIA